MNIGPSIVFGSADNFLSFLRNYGSVKDQEQLLNTVFQDSNRRLTPLMTAILEEKTDIARVIVDELKGNLDVHQNCYFVDSETGQTYHSVTALFCAAYKGYGELVRQLAKHNCNVNCTTNSGETPMFIACCKGDPEMVKVLLDLRASVTLGAGEYRDVTPLHAASRLREPQCAALLFAYGQENLVDLHTSTLLFSISPAHMTAMFGGLEVFKCLHFYGANLAKRNKLDMTMLMAAAAFGNEDICRYLIDLKPTDIHSTTSTGTSALHLASLYGHLPVIEFLLSNGADMDSPDAEGATCHDYQNFARFHENFQVLPKHKLVIHWLDHINKIAQCYEPKSRIYTTRKFGDFESLTVINPT